MISVRNITSSERGNVVCADLPYLAVATPNEEPPIAGDLTDRQYEAGVSAVEFFEDGEFASAADDENNELLDAGSESDSDSDVEDDDDLDLATRLRMFRPAEAPAEPGSYEANAIAFFAGYTANKLSKVHPCDCCRDILAKKVSDTVNANERYTVCREYVSDDTYLVTSLKRPTDRYYKIVEAQLQSFLPVFIQHKHEGGILRKLVAHAIDATTKIDPQWFDESDPCNNHRIFAVRFMLRVKLQRYCQLDNRAAKSKSQEKRRAAAAKRNALKPVRKMRNILHTHG
ncbi:uncharacterized protein LOC125501094 [Athalia rosae]|uniref:uncharacterized protein LOC125501094 n=1 Tax=Athalia rosae TaxID=37344 RepID=UPI002033D8C0|nr:uncharacterized protein LOC125501094 [Athalia rosae]